MTLHEQAAEALGLEMRDRMSEFGPFSEYEVFWRNVERVAAGVVLGVVRQAIRELAFCHPDDVRRWEQSGRPATMAPERNSVSLDAVLALFPEDDQR